MWNGNSNFQCSQQLRLHGLTSTGLGLRIWDPTWETVYRKLSVPYSLHILDIKLGRKYWIWKSCWLKMWWENCIQLQMWETNPKDKMQSLDFLKAWCTCKTLKLDANSISKLGVKFDIYSSTIATVGFVGNGVTYDTRLTLATTLFTSIPQLVVAFKCL